MEETRPTDQKQPFYVERQEDEDDPCRNVDCENCRYGDRIYPNSFDDPYIICTAPW